MTDCKECLGSGVVKEGHKYVYCSTCLGSGQAEDNVLG